MATSKPTAPKTEELAKPDDFLGLSGIAPAIANYVNILVPEDIRSNPFNRYRNLAEYTALLKDDQVKSTFQQRRSGTVQAELIVEAGDDRPESKACADEALRQIKALRFDDITEKVLYAVFYGWGVAEILWGMDGKYITFENIKVRNRGRFLFDQDSNLYLQRNGVALPELMPDKKFWVINSGADHDDAPYGYGLAHSLYWPVFFKRNDIKFWLVFLERFGQPTALMQIPAGQMENEKKVGEAKAILKMIATDSGIVVPDNAVISLLEAARSGAADYAQMRIAMDDAISKIVLSQTMTTDSKAGGFGSQQAKVHAQVKDDVVASDADLVCETFNRGPLTWWRDFNFPTAAVPRIYRNTDPPEDINARADRDAKVYALGFEPTQEYISETYGEGWVKREIQAPAITPNQGGNNSGSGDAQFAEPLRQALMTLKSARRADQDAIVTAAGIFAGKDEILAKRLNQIIQAAEFAEDDAVFRQRIDELLAELPPPETVDNIARGNLFSRLLGTFRAQRRA